MIEKLRADERGITPVLGAALVIGIVITTFSVFLAVWVPGELHRRGREYLSRGEGLLSFLELRAKIEGLEIGESRSVHVKMAPEPVPFIPNLGRGGTLSVFPSTDNDYGTIKLTLGDSSLVYESGMLIWVQNNENLMRSAPRVVAVREIGDKLEVVETIIKVRGLEDSISSTGTAAVTVSIYQENEGEKELLENVTIQINSRYGNAWIDYLWELSESLEEKGYYVSASKSEIENLQLTILGKDPEESDIYYYRKITEIWVSIS